MTDYSNILQAINGMNSGQSNSMADLTRRNENFKLVDQLNNEGVSLKDALGQIEALKKEIEELKKPPKAVDEDLFAVMEASVASEPEVIEAKRKVAIEKNRVIAELCAKDPQFMATRDEYRRTVKRMYIEKKEGAGEAKECGG